MLRGNGSESKLTRRTSSLLGPSSFGSEIDKGGSPNKDVLRGNGSESKLARRTSSLLGPSSFSSGGEGWTILVARNVRPSNDARSATVMDGVGILETRWRWLFRSINEVSNLKYARFLCRPKDSLTSVGDILSLLFGLKWPILSLGTSEKVRRADYCCSMRRVEGSRRFVEL